MIRKFACALACALLIASPAIAERRVTFQPVPAEGQEVRFYKGTPTADMRRERGAVQITPLGLDHGRLTFGIVVLNLGTGSDNFGVENIRASINGQDSVVLTRDRLDRMARNRAMWSQIAVAAVAGLAAASAASQRDTYTATTYGPSGTYRTIIDAPSTGGQVAAAGIAAGGAYSIATIQNRLDETRASLADEIVQTTTVDPDATYGGRVVVEKLRGRANRFPQQVRLVITFNGEDYPFEFAVAQVR